MSKLHFLKSKEKIVFMAVRWRSFFKVPVSGRKPGLRGKAKLADDAHEPVLQILQKQNRELSYASVRGGKPDTSRYN